MGNIIKKALSRNENMLGVVLGCELSDGRTIFLKGHYLPDEFFLHYNTIEEMNNPLGIRLYSIEHLTKSFHQNPDQPNINGFDINLVSTFPEGKTIFKALKKKSMGLVVTITEADPHDIFIQILKYPDWLAFVNMLENTSPDNLPFINLLT